MGASISAVTIAGTITNNLSVNAPIPDGWTRGLSLVWSRVGGGARVSVRTSRVRSPFEERSRESRSTLESQRHRRTAGEFEVLNKLDVGKTSSGRSR